MKGFTTAVLTRLTRASLKVFLVLNFYFQHHYFSLLFLLKTLSCSLPQNLGAMRIFT